MGRKFIIELEDDYFENDEGEELWRVKGFKSLVFDKNGLDKLKEYKEPPEISKNKDIDSFIRFMVNKYTEETSSIRGKALKHIDLSDPESDINKKINEKVVNSEVNMFANDLLEKALNNCNDDKPDTTPYYGNNKEFSKPDLLELQLQYDCPETRQIINEYLRNYNRFIDESAILINNLKKYYGE